ncbi:NACHT domain-containing protein [Streptomyces sp. NPDC088707]|uniref:NACHT domain-containing protein n=1 Tax=Streptomyces sp. NPDC088707 TaxID=3365871 RepID=UPI00380008C5
MDDPLDGGLMGAVGPARNALAAALHAARLRTGASPSAVGAVLRLSAGSVSAFEQGSRIPPPDLLGVYATAVDLAEDHLRGLRRAAEAEAADEAELDAEFEDSYAEFVLRSLPGSESLGLSRSLPVLASGRAGPGGGLEEALSEGGRAVLRGSAGSGKTTYVLGLAADAARAIRGRDDASAVVPVPFLVRAGHLDVARELPRPADLLRSWIGRHLPPAPPTGWPERVLASGRGLLLVDGIDEVAPQEREKVAAWLRELLSAYPATACLVTTRPAAVRSGWLEPLGFSEFVFGPLRTADLHRIVAAWREHRRGRTGDALPPERWDALLRVLETDARLRELLTNPVMCDTVCALFQGSGGRLPLDRIAVCQALLSPSRWSRHPDGGSLDLPEDKQVAALRGVALPMLRNGNRELPYLEAVAGVRLALGTRLIGEGAAESVLRTLLNHSGVLTTSAGDTVAFVHSAVTSYLAAQLFLEEGLSELIDRAHLDHWRDTVVFAAQLAAPPERAELIRAVEFRGDADREHRTRLWLLAAEAARASPALDAVVREEVEERRARVIPPRSDEDVAALAQLGPHVIHLLPGPEDIPADDPAVALLLRTAELIGGEIADAYRLRFTEAAGSHGGADGGEESRYKRPGGLRLPPLALETWSHTSARGGPRTAPRLRRSVPDGPYAPEVPEGDARRGVCRGDAEILPELWELPELHTLAIEDNPSLTELGGLAHLPKLRTLVITGCPHLRDLTDLRHSGVMFLQLDDEPADELLDTLASAARLRALYLRDAGPGFDPAGIGRRLPGVAVLGGGIRG